MVYNPEQPQQEKKKPLLEVVVSEVRVVRDRLLQQTSTASPDVALDEAIKMVFATHHIGSGREGTETEKQRTFSRMASDVRRALRSRPRKKTPVSQSTAAGPSREPVFTAEEKRRMLRGAQRLEAEDVRRAGEVIDEDT
jgi:hypothetical protein